MSEREREGERETDRERDRERQRDSERVCERENERESECVCVRESRINKNETVKISNVKSKDGSKGLCSRTKYSVYNNSFFFFFFLVAVIKFKLVTGSPLT